ncbi:MAG: hypothetical protein WA197_10295 [Candidatus Acidiferrales bacterium]
MGIFDSTEEHPPSKVLRYIITAVVFVALIGLWAGYEMRFHTEEKTVRHFMGFVVAGQLGEAYRMYKPAPSYSFKDFTDDFGPQGYYGPIKSFHIEHAEEIKQGPERPSGVVITVEVSPYQPFPGDHDALKEGKTKEVRLQVEYKDQSLGFAP